MKIVNNKLKGREQAKNVYDNIQKFFFLKKKVWWTNINWLSYLNVQFRKDQQKLRREI